MKCYMLRVGAEWAIGGERGDTTPDRASAKTWRKIGHVRSHITGALSGRWTGPHPYRVRPPEIVACEIVECSEGQTAVALPIGDDVLADFLESLGHHDAAARLRGAL